MPQGVEETCSNTLNIIKDRLARYTVLETRRSKRTNNGRDREGNTISSRRDEQQQSQRY